MKKLKNKITYIWDYYKLRIVFIIIGIIFVVTMVYKFTHKATKDLYIGFVNVTVGDNLKYYLLENTSLYIQSYENLLLDQTSANNVEYTIASQTKILAAIETNQLDLVILDEDSMGAFSQNGYLIDIKKYVATQCPSLNDSFNDYYVKNIDLSDETNPIEFYSAIDLSFNKKIVEAGFSEKVYLAIIKNTNHKKSINSYLSYLAIKQ